MDEHSKEITGFLCRWCVLALAATAAIGAGAMAVRAIAAAPTETRARLMLPDAIRRPPAAGQEVLIPCQVEPGDRAAVQVLWEAGDGKVREGHGPVWWHLRYWDPPAQGRVGIRLMGNPFCTVGLEEVRATLLMAPLPRDLYLLDARLAARQVQPHAAHGELHDLLAEMSPRGDVAFVTPGDCHEMLPLRALLREAGLTEPVLGEMHPKSPVDVLRQTRRALRLSAKRPLPAENVVLISDDASFVRAALANGHRACLVGGSVLADSPRLRQFPSLTNLKDWLARQPISK